MNADDAKFFAELAQEVGAIESEERADYDELEALLSPRDLEPILEKEFRMLMREKTRRTERQNARIGVLREMRHNRTDAQNNELRELLTPKKLPLKKEIRFSELQALRRRRPEELKRIEELQEKVHRSAPYDKALNHLWAKALATDELAKATSEAIFTPHEAKEFSVLTDRVAELAREGKRLSATEQLRYRQLDARTQVLPQILRRIRNAALAESAPDEIISLVDEAMRVPQTWPGGNAAAVMRIVVAVGRIVDGCGKVRGNAEGARDVLRRIIALEIEPEEREHGGHVDVFRSEQLDMVYSEEVAAHRGTERHLEANRKFVMREREKGKQMQSADNP